MYTVTTKAPTIRLKIRLKKTRILPKAVIGPIPLAPAAPFNGIAAEGRRRTPSPTVPLKFPCLRAGRDYADRPARCQYAIARGEPVAELRSLTLPARLHFG